MVKSKLFQVASSLMLHKHAQTWSVLKTLYSENLPSPKASTVGVNSGGGLGTTLVNSEPQSGLSVQKKTVDQYSIPSSTNVNDDDIVKMFE